MPEKIRKILCEERAKHDITDSKKYSNQDIHNLCGYYYPDKHITGKKQTWEVTTLFEGEGYTAKTQFEAEVIANQEMIKGLLLKQALAKKTGGCPCR